MKPSPEGPEQHKPSAQPPDQQHHGGVAEDVESKRRMPREVHQQPGRQNGQHPGRPGRVDAPIDEGKRGKIRLKRERGGGPGPEFGGDCDAHNGAQLQPPPHRIPPRRLSQKIISHDSQKCQTQNIPHIVALPPCPPPSAPTLSFPSAAWETSPPSSFRNFHPARTESKYPKRSPTRGMKMSGIPPRQRAESPTKEIPDIFIPPTQNANAGVNAGGMKIPE